MRCNCRVRDIAVVVRAEPGCESLIGNVVKVERTFTWRGKTLWWIEDFVDMTLSRDAHQLGVEFKAGQTVKIGGIPDDWLLPILDTQPLRRYVRQA